MQYCFVQDVKRGRYNKLQSADQDILRVVAKLGLQTESRTSMSGVALLPAASVSSLMVDKRKVSG